MTAIPHPGWQSLPKDWQILAKRYYDVPSESLHAVEMMVANGVAQERLLDLKASDETLHWHRRTLEEAKNEMLVQRRDLSIRGRFTEAKALNGGIKEIERQLEEINKRFLASINVRLVLQYREAALKSLHPELSSTICPIIPERCRPVALDLPTFDLKM